MNARETKAGSRVPLILIVVCHHTSIVNQSLANYELVQTALQVIRSWCVKDHSQRESVLTAIQ